MHNGSQFATCGCRGVNYPELITGSNVRVNMHGKRFGSIGHERVDPNGRAGNKNLRTIFNSTMPI